MCTVLIIPVLRRPKQEDHEFEVNLNYAVSKRKRKFLIDRGSDMETWGRSTEKVNS